MTSESFSKPRRDINDVLAGRNQQLMSIPGVVGVYVGQMADQRTPCLKVMLARKDRQQERSIPKVLDGYSVVTEVSGEIKPMSP
jgi:hypothetical protein